MSAEGVAPVVESLQASGRTVAVVAVDGVVIGAGLGDELRPDAVEAVARMKAAGMKPVLVTGDNERAARVVADRAGIEDVHRRRR